jgi:putative ABC transport system permease protein
LIVQELFDAPSVALGQKILIAGIAFQVIGILGGIEEREFLDAVMIPISIARGQISDSYEIRDMYIRATHWQTVRRLHGEIKSVLQRNHPGYADTIVVRYFPKRIEKIENALSVVHILLLAALSVALVVGVVGIANVMLTAVQERTIEIGLRKVHGATERAIRVQFLGEAVITTLAGALLGIVMGVGAVKALEVALAIDANHTVLFVTTAAVALFGVAAGILSGFVPARRASSLDPGAALRFE